MRLINRMTLLCATAAFTACAPKTALTVTTYNIHHGEGVDERVDLERIAREAATDDPDVLCLQEVDRHFSGRSDFADQADDLAAALNMRVVYAPNLDFEPPEAGRPRCQYGTAVLSKHEILLSRNTLLPRPENGEQRGLLEVVISVRGMRVRVANTHLEYDKPLEQTAQVARVMELLTGADEPVILTGDFNAPPDSRELAPLFEHYHDAWKLGGSGEGWTEPAEAPSARIDYILVTPDIDVRSAVVRLSSASDHLPLTAKMLLKYQAY